MLQKINWSAISPDESEKLKNELVEVWEASVRSTHRFLTEKEYPVLQAVNPEQIYSGCRIIHHPKWTKPDSCIYGTK